MKSNNIISKLVNRVATSREQISIHSISNDILEIEKGQFRAIFEVEPLNFLMKSNHEQDVMTHQYQSFLNSIGFPIQILVRVKRRNLDDYVNGYREEASEEKDGFRATLLSDYANHVEDFIDRYRVLERKFYIVIAHDRTEDEDEILTKNKIMKKCDSIYSTLRSIGLDAKQLETPEIVSLFYDIYHNNNSNGKVFDDFIVNELNARAKEQEESILEGKRKKNKKNDNIKRYFLPDTIDVLSYGGVEEMSDHFIMDGVYKRVMKIIDYPSEAYTGWLDDLMYLDKDVDIAIHIEPTEIAHTVSRYEKNITELESQIALKTQKGFTNTDDLEDKLAQAKELRRSLVQGEERIFMSSIYFMLSSESKQELDMDTDEIVSKLNGGCFTSSPATYQQLDGFQSVLPRCEDVLDQKRNFDTTCLSVSFPFGANEMIHKNGILFGLNNVNRSLVLYDRFNNDNSNSVIFGRSGSGKSFASKVEILRSRMLGIKVIVIDPEAEYRQVCEYLGGEYIKISGNSQYKINPLDMVGDSDEDSGGKVRAISGLISVMVGGVNATDRSMLDKAIVEVYSQNKEPILEDLVSLIKKHGGEELATKLYPYSHGSMKHFFNCRTNINLSNPMVVFDINDISDKVTREIMMLLITDYVNMLMMKKKEKRMLVIDEAWIMLQHKETAEHLESFSRRGRKYNLGLSIISQQIEDFLDSPQGSTIIKQAASQILMKQSVSSIEKVSKYFNLSEYETEQLAKLKQGNALIMSGDEHALATISASDEEMAMITTNPNEIVNES